MAQIAIAWILAKDGTSLLITRSLRSVAVKDATQPNLRW